eukprot:1673710-Alexandrium_andersonii.AAC.1
MLANELLGAVVALAHGRVSVLAGFEQITAPCMSPGHHRRALAHYGAGGGACVLAANQHRHQMS